jgi:putative hemolysin
MPNPFKLSLKPRLISAVLERLLGLRAMQTFYDSRPKASNARGFLQHAINYLGVTVACDNRELLNSVPRKGSFLFVANHPLGGLEGIVLARLLMDIRPDLKVLTNELLCRIPELGGFFVGVDVLSGGRAANNLAGIRKLHAHLAGGGALLVFPAGAVATFNIAEGRITDRPWNRLVGQLVNRHHCACLPIQVSGRNSWYFYVAALIHHRLRTALLPRQLVNKNGFPLQLLVGNTIPGEELLALQDAQAITDYLRISTDALAIRSPEAAVAPQKPQRIADDIAQKQLQRIVPTLHDCRLIEHREFDVYCAPQERLGVLMQQIAIAREFSFRAAGEGTGLDRDSDRFDQHYLHLLLWDKQACRVAGAYRIGLVDEIIRQRGMRGLYTRSLYKYNTDFIRRLGPAVELGRSFIHPDYQRRPAALHLLWRGIGQFIVKHPQYHTLFGSVSISRDYTDIARALIEDAMLANYRAEHFSDKVKPRSLHRIGNRPWSTDTLKALANIKILSKLIGRCDPGKALPVLLRHYLSLNGRLVCFNVHAKFNDALEGLIIVDLRLTEAKTAIRFMGEAGYNHFLARQEQTRVA